MAVTNKTLNNIILKASWSGNLNKVKSNVNILKSSVFLPPGPFKMLFYLITLDRWVYKKEEETRLSLQVNAGQPRPIWSAGRLALPGPFKMLFY